MGKHGTGKRPEPEPVKVVRRSAANRGKPPPTVVPASPEELANPAVALRLAARRVVAALDAAEAIRHTEHAPGCPSGGGGPCCCGVEALQTALGELREALNAP